MLTSHKIRGVLLYLAGAATAVAIMLAFFGGPAVLAGSSAADQYNCIRTDLDAQGMTGNIPDPEFTITYDVPACYANNNYRVQRVYMYGDQVAVHYATTE